jgi:hypothetical protein
MVASRFDLINPTVIPGRTFGASPESITTAFQEEASSVTPFSITVGGYGFWAPLRGPGMTVRASLLRHGRACPGHPDAEKRDAQHYRDHRHKAGDDVELRLSVKAAQATRPV